MRAVRVHEFGPPEAMVVEDVPEPEVGSGQVLIKIEAIGVNPLDTYIRAGIMPGGPELPYTPGGDAAGTIEAVGEDIAEFSVGDRVYMASIIGNNQAGAMAEQAVVSAAAVFPLPDNVDFAAGAALGVPYATAYVALHLRGLAQPDQTVFVHGASGAVGSATVQMARALGMTVIGSASSEKGRQLVLDQGADHAVDHSDPGYLDELRALTEGLGPNLIIEMLANVNLAKDLEVIATNGRIVIIGSRGEIEITPRALMVKNADVAGMAITNTPLEDMQQIHAELYKGLENGSLNPVICREMALADAAASHHAVMESGAYGKIILRP